MPAEENFESKASRSVVAAETDSAEYNSDADAASLSAC
jgi:hypothetical protein